MSEKTPIVSIIIPCYNYSQFVAKTIDSALAQSYENCEVIVVDDGSTDDSAKVIQAYGKSVRYIFRENGGLSAARNTGIAEARGEYLVFLDADDLLKAQMVSTSVEVMEGLDERFGIVANRQTWIDVEGRVVETPYVFPTGSCEITALDLLVRNRFPVTVLAKKQVFDRCGGFDEELSSSEDRDMWVRTAAAGFRIMRLGEPLFFVRRHGGNMSRDGESQSRSVKRVQQKALSSGLLSGLQNIYRLKVKSYYMCQTSIMKASKQPLRSCFRMAASISLWPIFGDLENLGEKPWFRLRMLRWIVSEGVNSKVRRSGAE